MTTLPGVEAEPGLASGGTGEAAHGVDALLPQLALVQAALVNVLDCMCRFQIITGM